jgi:hypothetical protein
LLVFAQERKPPEERETIERADIGGKQGKDAKGDPMRESDENEEAMVNPRKTTVISLRLPNDAYERYYALAEAKGTTVAKLAIRGLQAFFEDELAAV